MTGHAFTDTGTALPRTTLNPVDGPAGSPTLDHLFLIHSDKNPDWRFRSAARVFDMPDPTDLCASDHAGALVIIENL